jgi:hypothetical protein
MMRLLPPSSTTNFFYVLSTIIFPELMTYNTIRFNYRIGI